MSTPDKPEQNFTGIRIQDERDRSPEFKNARDQLVGNVNNWLDALAKKRDAGEPLPDGTPIVDTPRITRTTLGKTAVGFLSVMEESEPGVSLTGDGVTTRFELQAVLPSANGQGVETIEVKGSDPIAQMVSGGEYAPRQSAVDVSFMAASTEGDEQARYFGYEVHGDGAVHRRFLRHDGYHTSTQLRTPDDVQLAAEAFSQVTTHFAE